MSIRTQPASINEADPSTAVESGRSRRRFVWRLPLAVIALLMVVSVGYVQLSAADPLSELGVRTAGSLSLEEDSYAFCVLLPDGRVLAHRADAAMKPASSLKLVTAAVALDTIGPEGMIETDLVRKGRVRAGVLDGDLIVVGRGDPNRPSSSANPLATLERWAELLDQSGVKRVTGRLLGDDTYFAGSNRLEDWPRNQWHRWYSAPCGALNLNDNCTDLTITPSPAGVTVSTFPDHRFLEVRNELAPVRSARDHRFSLDRRPGSWEIVLRGKFLATREPLVQWVTVEDPTLAYLGAFERELLERGIVVDGELARGRAPEDGVLLDRVGHSVVSALPRLLKRSHNLHGDCLLRHVDRRVGGNGSFASAGAMAERRMRERFGWKGPLVVRDGSGLSHDDRVNARDMVRMLAKVRTLSWGEHLTAALPVSGVDGTLAKRFRKTSVGPAVRAKTGHVSGVSALAGYLDTTHGPAVFALLYQGKPSRVAAARRWQEAYLDQLYAAIERGGRD